MGEKMNYSNSEVKTLFEQLKNRQLTRKERWSSAEELMQSIITNSFFSPKQKHRIIKEMARLRNQYFSEKMKEELAFAEYNRLNDRRTHLTNAIWNLSDEEIIRNEYENFFCRGFVSFRYRSSLILFEKLNFMKPVIRVSSDGLAEKLLILKAPPQPSTPTPKASFQLVEGANMVFRQFLYQTGFWSKFSQNSNELSTFGTSSEVPASLPSNT